MELVDWVAFAIGCIALTVLIFRGTSDPAEQELRKERKRFDRLVTTLMDLDEEYANRDLLKKEIENTNARVQTLKAMTRKKHS